MKEPIHITVPASPDDPRRRRKPPPGVVIHYVSKLHPDDVTVLKGIPVTSPARTLIDCAEEADREELREMFREALRRGIVQMEEVHAARRRVEWRPSLAMLDEVIAEFS
jgi:hypothetical protein